MQARQQAQDVLDRLVKQAKPTPKPKNIRRGSRRRGIICPMCVDLNRDVTEHVVDFKAKGCPEHADKMQMRVRYLRHGHKMRAKNRARYWAKREERIAYQKAYQASPRGQAITKAYREANRERKKQWMIEYRVRKRKKLAAIIGSIIPAEVW